MKLPEPTRPGAASPKPVHPNVACLLSADDLAARWQVPRSQVYRLTREGLLPTVRIGRYYRYRLAAVEAFEVAGGVMADA